MDMRDEFLVRPGKKVRLDDYDPDNRLEFKHDDHEHEIQEKLLQRLDELQYLLYASKKFALLIVLQAIDSGGKDGTIRHVMSGVDPQGCRVTSFKLPTPDELTHDFLWRIHNAVPPRGDIGIFNRSHYEEVLVVRVHKLVPRTTWSKRYEEINRFEKFLTENDVRILKFYLHISRQEQLKRFEARIHDPTKNWKLSPADFHERNYWKAYVTAYEDALSKCSTKWAPWYIIPANHKWFRNLAVSQIIVKTLDDMKLKYPKPSFNVRKLKIKE
ncbi:MAG TPA: polyphosphate kinase 2 family protein [Candidatus Acidoferrales bacterium]|nr:polyphosphate kinase 2 family protein [Candidatus Acidoferrales bacterium]